MVHLGQGHLADAQEFLISALKTFREINDQGGVAWSLERLAALAFSLESYERAAILLSAGSSIRERVGSTIPVVYKPDVEQLKADVASRLEPGPMDQAWQEGSDLDLDDAVSYALSVGTSVPTS